MAKLAAVVLVIALATRPLSADEPASAPAATLADAQEQLAAGQYALAAQLAGPLARDPRSSPPERAEAYRIYGLSLYFLGMRAEAEAALYAFLRLEPEAHLDPALVPPDAVVFFEEVRSRHAGELLRLRPRPHRRHYALLSLLPPVGQIQNGDRTKAWILGGLEASLLAANLGTFLALRSMCRTSDKTCGDRPGLARFLQGTNVVSGILLATTLVYGIVDGYLGYRRVQREESWRPPDAPATAWSIDPIPGGAVVTIGRAF